MKRHPKLQGLSSEHHAALVLARRLVRHVGAWSAEDAAMLQDRFVRELEPHFRLEEQVLLPALRERGEADLVRRTLEDHAALRELAGRASAADSSLAQRIGQLLQEHVRFEEQELFPRCESLLPEHVLDLLPARAPRGR